MSAPMRPRRFRQLRQRKRAAARPLPPLWPVLAAILLVGAAAIIATELIAGREDQVIRPVERADSLRAVGSKPGEPAPRRPRPLDPR